MNRISITITTENFNFLLENANNFSRYINDLLTNRRESIAVSKNVNAKIDELKTRIKELELIDKQDQIKIKQEKEAEELKKLNQEKKDKENLDILIGVIKENRIDINDLSRDNYYSLIGKVKLKFPKMEYAEIMNIASEDKFRKACEVLKSHL